MIMYSEECPEKTKDPSQILTILDSAQEFVDSAVALTDFNADSCENRH